ncbi:unnamed protein product, partial [Rotaria socialis]
MAIDLDINTRLDEAQFLTNFDYSIDEWDAMTASQFGGYYDIWALRDKVVNYDCWHRATNIIIRLITLNRGVEAYISVHQKSIPPDHPL